MTRIGVLGAGRMGSPIIRAFLAVGHEVVVFDPDGTRVRDVVDVGAVSATDPVAVAAAVDVLVTVLPGPGEAELALAGSAGALAALASGGLWLDLTSNDPRVASRLGVAAREHGVDAVAAPMAGGVPAAESRTLGFFVGGEPAALDRALPLLAHLGPASSIRHTGADLAAAHSAKLLVNLLWFGQVVAVTETLLLAKALGLKPADARRLLAGSAAGSAFIDNDLDRLLSGDYLETFGIDRVVEELGTLTELAREHEVPFELSELVERLHREALSRFGAVDGELLAARLLEERGGTALRG